MCVMQVVNMSIETADGMVSRHTFPGITMAPGDSLTLTWNFNGYRFTV